MISFIEGVIGGLSTYKICDGVKADDVIWNWTLLKENVTKKVGRLDCAQKRLCLLTKTLKEQAKMNRGKFNKNNLTASYHLLYSMD